MLVISGRQFTRTNWSYFWIAVAGLMLGVGPVILLTMVATLKRDANTGLDEARRVAVQSISVR
jgi:hypothetical protein